MSSSKKRKAESNQDRNLPVAPLTPPPRTVRPFEPGTPLSPMKRRDPKKTKTMVEAFGVEDRQAYLQRKLLALKTGTMPVIETRAPDSLPSGQDVEMQDAGDASHEDSDPDVPIPKANPFKKSGGGPNLEARRKYDQWKTLLADKWEALLEYLTSSYQEPLQEPPEKMMNCVVEKGKCDYVETVIECLFFDYFKDFSVVSCACSDVHTILIKHGLFPCSPDKPQRAVSIAVIEFYSAIFEKSSDAVHAIAHALKRYYTRRGFISKNKENQRALDPFRKGFSSAHQWYWYLRLIVEQKKKEALDRAAYLIPSLSSQKSKDQRAANGPPAPVDMKVEASTDEPDGLVHATRTYVLDMLKSNETSNTQQPLLEVSGKPDDWTDEERTTVSRFLQQRCPACFGALLFGKPFDKGADIMVCLDGNFNHRHYRSKRNCPPFYKPDFFIPKTYVDEVGRKIVKARKRQAKNYVPVVPDPAVDTCEKSHESGSGSTTKTPLSNFDAGGLMGMVCRHDIPLFFANIDTPGEQQKYAVALIQTLFSHLPKNANVWVLYDVACVLDRSRKLASRIVSYDIFTEDVNPRVAFATSAMHAYAHHWACQLVYNPRMIQGLALFDGEGQERLWSRMTGLIGITRVSANNKRYFIIDRKAAVIASEGRDNLGAFIKRRLTKNIPDRENDARKTLEECELTIDELREQWDHQKASQLSLRAYAPARLKKQLDSLFKLQTEVEASQKTLKDTIDAIAETGKTGTNKKLIEKMQAQHGELLENIDELYSALNIQGEFPELKDVSYQFLLKLLLAHDLKINIRKRAIGSFFEWDRLDQAVKGRDKPLGTKIHQKTRQSIQKRSPALISALRRFNKLCQELAHLHQPEWDIPVPEPLPTTVRELRESQVLLQDVWISRSGDEPPPLWLIDQSVRDGIRAMLILDRCKEERQRLAHEADNMHRWYQQELTSFEVALANPENDSLRVLLFNERSHLFSLNNRWASSYVSTVQYLNAIRKAKMVGETAMASLPESGRSKASVYVKAFVEHDDPTVSELDGGVPQVLEDREAEREGDNDSDSDSDSDNENDPEEQDDGDPMDDDTVVGEDSQIKFKYIPPLDTEDDPDGSEMTVPPGSLNLVWKAPDPCFVDGRPLDLSTPNPRTNVHRDCSTRRTFDLQFRGLQRRYHFNRHQLQIFNDPTAWLDDDCINSGSVFLQHISLHDSPASHACCILSSFLYRSVKFQSPDDELWRLVKHSQFWDRDVWIIPIHHVVPAKHWSLAFVHVRLRQIFIFDSLASRSSFRHGAENTMLLVVRLARLSALNGHRWDIPLTSGWTARPVLTTSLQHDGYSCGIWVLVEILAVLHSQHLTGLTENDLPSFRRTILNCILALSPNPIAN
ncbi:hypothetical protein FA15DRAFT_709976 [Coprinopsis marcescibilis]|uniref:Ubiquitin-like protease family profile domain-containing protein n=1 Tax=Coprinopsis marcescibilis TaxID=230819 RepID=A0A5C3KEU7_COPMA|nr:hypothetical protein FA15DRAFT_709976 [Coprinopsis marcescibilis]